MSVSLAPKGSAFVRAIIAKALAKDEPGAAEDIAVARWGAQSPFYQKAAVAGGATSGSWADDLAPSPTAAAEFLSLVRERSVLGRLSGRRRVPANIRVLEQTAGFGGAAWIAAGAAIPMGTASFTASSLDLLKVAAGTVVTEDLLRDSSPAAEALIRGDLVRLLVEAVDTALLDPDNAGVPGEQPASITNGEPSIGTSHDALIAAFAGDLTRAFWVTSPAYAASLNSADRPNIGARGGELLGVPVLTSRMAPGGLILVDPGLLAVAEGGVEVKTSRQGSLQMDDAPSNDAVSPTATTLVSLWQGNAVGVAALWWLNWRIQAGAVSMLAPA